MRIGVVEHDGFLWIPILPKQFVGRLAALDLDIKRRDDWPKEIRDEYDGLRGQFTKAKAEFSAWVRKDRDSRMNANAKLIVNFLIDSVNFDTGRLDPSHQTIADELEVSLRTVERLIPQIAAAGWIGITRRGKTITNLYRLRVPAEKVHRLLDRVDDLREKRKLAWEERQRQRSDPTELADHPHSDPPFARTHEPTKLAGHEPTKLAGKPLKRTPEGEHLKRIKSSEEEGYSLRAREAEPINAYAQAKEG